MKCPICGSEQVQIQAKEHKPRITFPLLLACFGFGMLFLGIIGAILGLIIGGIISALLYTLMPQGYQSVLVCQRCGFTGTEQTIKHVVQHPLYSSSDDSNLTLIRNHSTVGVACAIEVVIDNFAPFTLGDGEAKYLRLTPGAHHMRYRQVNGMGKDKRQGLVTVNVSETPHTLQFDFLKNEIKLQCVK